MEIIEVTKIRGKSQKDEEEEDRISKLPHEIQYHVLSFLSPTESARTSVLSKTWLQTWSTNPDLRLDQSLFCKNQITIYQITYGRRNFYPTDDETRKFETYVNRTLTRYENQKIDVQSLSLCVKILDSNLASQVENWIQIAINMDTSPRLYINIMVDLSLPPSQELVKLLLASHILRSLSLTALECVFPTLGPTLFSDVTIKCKSLKMVELNNVVVKESEIEYLLSCCPIIEKIALRHCTGFKKICVKNLCCLETFIIEADKDMLMVDIEAPKLRLFIFNGNMQNPGVVNIKPNPSLDYLHLSNTIITNRDFKNLFSSFPLLKYLLIQCPKGLERIDISSSSLEQVKIVLDLDQSQVEGKIDAPGLYSFKYMGCFPSITFSKHTNPVSRVFWIRPLNNFNASFFLDLRDFTLKHKLSRVNVSLLHRPIGDVDFEELSAAVEGSTLEVEELHLSTKSLKLEEQLIESFLWIFRPKYFYLYCFEDDTNAENFLYEIFTTHRLNYCILDQFKGWRHYLSEVEIESFERDEEHENCVIWKFKLLYGSMSICGSN